MPHTALLGALDAIQLQSLTFQGTSICHPQASLRSLLDAQSKLTSLEFDKCAVEPTTIAGWGVHSLRSLQRLRLVGCMPLRPIDSGREVAVLAVLDICRTASCLRHLELADVRTFEESRFLTRQILVQLVSAQLTHISFAHIDMQEVMWVLFVSCTEQGHRLSQLQHLQHLSTAAFEHTNLMFLEQMVGHWADLTCLDLRGHSSQNSSAAAAANSLQVALGACPGLQELRISSDLNGAAIKSICKGITHMHMLKHLSIQCPADVSKIVAALGHVTALQQLKLQWPSVSVGRCAYEAEPQLATLLQTCGSLPALTELTLSGPRALHARDRRSFSVLTNLRSFTLDLSGAAGAWPGDHVFWGMCQLRQLEHFALCGLMSWHVCQPQQVDAFNGRRQGLHELSALTSLYIEYAHLALNSAGSPRHAAHLLQVCTQLPSLAALRLLRCRWMAGSSTLQDLPKLQSLHVPECSIDDAAVAELVSQLSELQNLCHLDLSRNQVTAEGLGVLSKLTGLSELKLHDVGVGGLHSALPGVRVDAGGHCQHANSQFEWNELM